MDDPFDILFSVFLGLLLTFLIYKSCECPKCITYKAPDDMDRVFKHEGKCYNFDKETATC